MIIVADPDRAFRARVAEQLGRRQDLLESDKVQQIEGLLAERANGCSVVILGPGLSKEAALATASKLQLASPDASVILVSASLTAELLQQAIHAGVKDALPSTFTPKQLTKAVEHAESLSRLFHQRDGERQAQPGEQGKVITVLSSKGGVGKSFLASNLAAVLAQRHGEVALVDLDLQFGDLAIMLQLLPTRTISDAAQDLERLDEQALRGYLTPHASKVHLLAAPLEPGLSDTISAEDTLTVARMLRGTYRYIVVDTPPSFSDHVLATVDESDHLISITTMDVPSIKNLRLSLQTLDMLNVAREKMSIVLNRADSKVGLSVAEVEKTLQRRVDTTMPSSRDVPLSINQGKLIVSEQPRSDVSHAITKLADLLVSGGTRPSPAKQKQTSHRFHLGRKR